MEHLETLPLQSHSRVSSCTRPSTSSLLPCRSRLHPTLRGGELRGPAARCVIETDVLLMYLRYGRTHRGATATFITSFLAIVPLAGLLGEATEQVSLSK